uniref:Uncharacterized protein n=1 Tax=Setaria viridis TaxID=4556 RepID=A0A4U6TJD1_SETVI|nr:hypothetical protein SEVIR_8G248001v2 [Setaria viridis]
MRSPDPGAPTTLWVCLLFIIILFILSKSHLDRDGACESWRKPHSFQQATVRGV